MTLRLRPPSAVTSAALLIILAQLVVRGVFVSRSWFLVDDHIFMADIARGEDDLAWYTRLHQGHFMPLSFLLVKLVVAVSEPYAWWPVAVEIVVLQALASLACWWMLRTVFGPGRVALVGLAVYGTTALTVPALMWWAVAINQYPHQIAFFGVVTAHVLYARTRRVRWVAVAGVFLTVGYLSYAKTGLVVVTVAALTLIWLVEGRPWDRFWRAVRDFRVAWVVYGALSVAWLVVYVTRPQAAVPARASQFVELAQAQLFEALLPTLVGGPLRWVDFGTGPVQFADPPVVMVVVAATLVAVVLLHSWGTYERSLLVLWPVGLYLFASAVLVYTGRAYTIGLLGGEGIGIHVQYLSDAAPLLLLAGVSLVRSPVDVADPPRRRPVPLVALVPAVPVRATLVGLVVLLGLISSAVYADGWRTFDERTVNQRAIADLRSHSATRLADVFAPSTVVAPVLGDKALLRNYFALLDDRYTTSLAGADLQTFDDAGRLRPADVVPVEGAVAAPAVRGCRPVGTTGRDFRLTPPTVLGPWVAVDYVSARPGTVSVGGIGVTRVGIAAPAGRHRILAAAPRPLDRVVVTASAGTSLCVTRVEYGLVAPS